MTKSKILFLDHTPFIGGAELALASHIRYLDKSKFEPFVACSSKNREMIQKFKESGAIVRPIGFPRLKHLGPATPIRFVTTTLEILQCILAHRADLVVSNTARAWLPAALAAKISGRKLLLWVRDFTYPRGLFRVMLPLADKVIFVSQSVQNHYISHHEKRLQVVYVGSDFDEKLKTISHQDVSRTKEELGIGGSDLVIGFVGRLVRWKGADALLKAAQILQSQFSFCSFKVVIIGSGRRQEQDIEKKLHRMGKAANLKNKVIFTGWRRDIPTLIKTFDIFVHPSVEPEPFATVVVEAMMAGLPVVGTNIGGTPEIIRDNQTGLLVPPNDPWALAKALLKLAKDANLRGRLGRAGWNLAQKANTEKLITKNMESVYLKVIKR